MSPLDNIETFVRAMHDRGAEINALQDLVGQLRISASARSREWLARTRETLLTPAALSVVGTAVSAQTFNASWARGSNSIIGASA